ncbi:hypothetical protein AGMMS49587_18410 [Spirochaetia bacterium]|nr:hypothetical protein AGMMS49587_18410 [Spirochaetia bacterium]
MNKRINFEDNIFILNARTRMIRDLLLLDTDPELFFEKTIDDINFIDNTLEIILKNLIENERLLDRNESFDSIFDLEWEFSQALSDLFNNEGNISALQFPVHREKIQVLRNRSLERRKVIDEKRGPAEAPTMENAVSSDELNELLKDF